MSNGYRHRGLTLIELLVAVAVIGVLIAVLVPALGHVRATAKTTQCLSNVRQIGVMVNAYLVASDGVLPSLQNRESTTQPLPAMDNVLVRPGEATKVFACPADDKGIFAASGTSYFWNFTVNGQRVEQLFSIVGGSAASRIPLISDKEGWHPEIKDRLVVLYADGHASRELTFLSELGVEAVPPSAPEPLP